MYTKIFYRATAGRGGRHASHEACAPCWCFAVCLCCVLALSLGGMAGGRAAFAQEFAPGESSIVLGEEEPVELSSEENGERIEVLAKVDTGAGYSSIDEDLAEDLGADLDDPEDTVKIRSAIGEEERPLVRVRLKVAGETLDTRVSVSDRSDLTKDMLLGSNDLEGFLVKPGTEQLTSPNAPRVESPVAALLEFPPPPPGAPTLLATLPLAAAFVVAARTLVGLKTFGLFAPVLLSLAFVQTGLPAGLLILGLMLTAGLVALPLLSPLRLPRVARLAVLMTIVSAVLLAANEFIDNPAVSSTWAAVFPVVVTAVVIERFSETR